MADQPKFYVNNNPSKDGQHDVYDENGELVCGTENSPEQATINIEIATGLKENDFTVTFEDMCTFDDGKTFPAWFDRPNPDDE